MTLPLLTLYERYLEALCQWTADPVFVQARMNEVVAAMAELRRGER